MSTESIKSQPDSENLVTMVFNSSFIIPLLLDGITAVNVEWHDE
jgi:hypothetical protein